MELSEEELHLWALAQERSRNEDTEGVVVTMRELVKRRPDSGVFAAVLANALKTLAMTDEALSYFKRAVSLSPRSEKVSLGLFHCLWASGKQEEALEEMKRFLSLANSDEYVRILAALQGSLS